MAAPSGTGAGKAALLRVVAECGQSMARAGELLLPHGTVPCPVFMPVGTRGTAKGITAEQLRALGCGLCLGNAYHLGAAPVSGAERGGERSGGGEAARAVAPPTCWLSARGHSGRPRPQPPGHAPPWAPPPFF